MHQDVLGLTMLPPSTVRPMLLLAPRSRNGGHGERTFFKLLDEVVHDLLELRGVDSKNFFKPLDVLQKILRQLMHRP